MIENNTGILIRKVSNGFMVMPESAIILAEATDEESIMVFGTEKALMSFIKGHFTREGNDQE